MASLTEKAVLSRSEAHDYVGGRPFFELLLTDYPDLLKPIRETRPPSKSARIGKTQYLRSNIDTVLKHAQLDGRYRRGA